MAWHQKLLIGFDLETTGTDPRESRIVTGALIEVRNGKPAGRKEWLADPGVPIPAEAVAVHGISSERAAGEGRPADRVADELARALTGYWDAGVPVVAYNATFDLTLLSAELQRHGLPSLSERLGGRAPAPVIDPYIIDRTADRYRKGKRNLTAVCEEYGVVLGEAHNALADALAAARLAVAIADRYPKLAALGPAALHRQQIEWYADWAADFQEFLRAKGNAAAVVETAWPMRALTDKVG